VFYLRWLVILALATGVNIGIFVENVLCKNYGSNKFIAIHLYQVLILHIISLVPKDRLHLIRIGNIKKSTRGTRVVAKEAGKRDKMA
jgi:hypothetical protein